MDNKLKLYISCYLKQRFQMVFPRCNCEQGKTCDPHVLARVPYPLFINFAFGWFLKLATASL